MRWSRIASSLLAIVLAGATADAAHAGDPWTSGPGFSDTGAPPITRVSASGHAALVWPAVEGERTTGYMAAARRPGEATFPVPVRIPTGEGRQVTDVDVADDGTVAMLLSGPGPPSVVVREPGGTFGPPETLPAAKQDVPYTVGQVAALPGGRAAAAYEDGWTVRVAERPQAGTFADVALSDVDSFERASIPAIDADAAGTLHLAWLHEDWSKDDPLDWNAVLAAVRGAGEASWSEPVRLNPPRMRQVFDVSVEVAPAGGAVVAWDGSAEQGGVVGGAVARGGAWRLGREAQFGLGAMFSDPVIGPTGQAFVIGGFDLSPDPAAVMAEAPIGGDLGAFGPMASAVPDGETKGRQGPEYLGAGVDGLHRLVTAWHWYGEERTWFRRPVLKIRQADGRWCGTAPFDGPPSEVRFALDAVGGGVAGWTNGYYLGSVGYASYTPSLGCPPVPDVWHDPPVLRLEPPGGYPERQGTDPPGPSSSLVPALPALPTAAASVAVVGRIVRLAPNQRSVALRVRCAGPRSCSGWLDLRGPRLAHAAAAEVGRVRFRIAPRRSKLVRVPLDRRSRAALRRHGRTKVVVRIRLAGAPRTVTSVRTVRAPERRR